jgi:hypothetical protein
MAVELSKKNITDDIVFISGLTRSGKAILCPIVSSFEKVEKVNVNFFLEQIPQLEHTNMLSNEAAVYLLRAGMNLMVYDNAIGRNANFRPDDFTSVWKNKDPMQYVQRLFTPDKDAVIEKLNKDKSIFSMMAHNALWHADLWFKAYPQLKIIHVQRNPVEIVYSWMTKNYGGDFYESTRANILTYNYKGVFIPYYAYGWEDEYLSYKETDRIILMVKKIIEKHSNSYSNLSQNLKNRVLFVRHHQIATDPDTALSKVVRFINTTYSSVTPRILLEERCPRTVDINEINKKISTIKKNTSAESFNELMNMRNNFNENVNTI